MYRKIMVATDGTPLSKKAVVTAIGMAQLCDAELTAVKVVPRYIQSYFEGSVPLGASEVKRIEAQWNQDAQKILDAVGKMAAAKGVKLKTVVLKSDQVADALVAAANKAKTDLIVMASHGRSGIKRLLLLQLLNLLLLRCKGQSVLHLGAVLKMNTHRIIGAQTSCSLDMIVCKRSASRAFIRSIPA